MPLASAVMDETASLLNDTAKEEATYTTMLPYLKMAWNKLQLKLQENGIAVAKEVSAVIDVLANAATIALPVDFLQPISVEERADGSSALFSSVEEIEDIPEMAQTDQILFWTWREENIEINPPRTAREVKLSYWKSLNPATSSTSNLNVINSQEYLANKTAALYARYARENPTRADVLEGEAGSALVTLINLEVKRKQNNPVRPRSYGKSAASLQRVGKIQI